MGTRHPEWVKTLVGQLSDDFGSTLWECFFKAERAYITASLPQMQTLERIYGASQQKVIYGLVCEAAHNAGLEVRAKIELITSDPSSVQREQPDTDELSIINRDVFEDLIQRLLEKNDDR